MEPEFQAAVWIARKSYPLGSNLNESDIWGEIPKFVSTLQWIIDLAQVNGLSALVLPVEKRGPLVHRSIDCWVRDARTPRDFDPRYLTVAITHAPSVLRVPVIIPAAVPTGNNHLRIGVRMQIVKPHQVGWIEIRNGVVGDPSAI